MTSPQDRCIQAAILLWGLYVGFSTGCTYLHVRLVCELNARSLGSCDLFSYVESYGVLVQVIFAVGTAHILVSKNLIY